MKISINLLLAIGILIITACNSHTHKEDNKQQDTSEILDKMEKDSTLYKIDSLEIISDTLTNTKP